MSPLTLLIVLLILAVLFGGYGVYRGRGPDATGWGWAGWSPLATLIVVILLLWAVGVLH